MRIHRALRVTPAHAQLRKRGVSQVRVLDGTPILGLRIRQRGFRVRAWQVAELRLHARRQDAQESPAAGLP